MTQNEISINKKDNVSFLMLLSLGFILPVFFLPFFNLSVSLSKTLLASVFIIVAFFLWLISRLKDSKFVFPKSSILGAGAIIVLVSFFSSVFSDAPVVSFVGLVGEVGTLISILLLYLLMFLSSVYFQDQKRVFYLYFTLLLSGTVVFLYQSFRFLLESFNVSFSGVLSATPQIMIGRWADTAIFFGLITILSLFTLGLVELNKNIKIVLRASIVLSLLALFFVNMKLVWVVVSFFALISFVYSISFGRSVKSNVSGKRGMYITSLSVLFISLFFVLAGGTLSNSIYSFFKIPQDVLRPSIGQTIDIAKGTFSENLFFGSGPNRFVNEWLLFKPDVVNRSPAWNLDFNTGSGLIPSFVVTTGVAGTLAWLIFFIAFLYSGVKVIFFARIEESYRYITLSSFVASLYLWIFSIFYISNITILFLTFLLTGVFVASLTQSKIIKNYSFSFLDDPRIGFVSVLVLILFIMSSVVGGYSLSKRFLSVVYFQKSISAVNIDGDIKKSEKNINSAIRLNKNDLYYRTFAEINLAQLKVLLAQSKSSDENPQIIARLAIKNAIIATEIDETNYLNWLFLARVYESLLTLPFVDANVLYQSAKQSYSKSLELNPKSPRIELLQARLELFVGNRDLAKEYISRAITKKNNYTEAIFLLSQVQEDEGNTDDAILSAEAAAFVSPQDIGVLFHLGLLKYRKEDYKGSIVAFERAVGLNTNYANAKYFLGLSYDKEGDEDKALRQFEDIKILNPNNVQVEKILLNLKVGRNALSDVSSPVDSDELPLEEE